jgi:hypothetical protein
MKTIKKAQTGIKKKPAPVKYRDEMGNPRTKAQQKKWEKGELEMIDYKGRPKMKSGGSFPDLNKDGKVTKKDVLIGRGVLPKTAKKGTKVAKSGAALKKQAATAIAMKKAGKSPKKMMGGGKCKYGCK